MGGSHRCLGFQDQRSEQTQIQEARRAFQKVPALKEMRVSVSKLEIQGPGDDSKQARSRREGIVTAAPGGPARPGTYVI